jgi:hypothetical protein
MGATTTAREGAALGTIGGLEALGLEEALLKQSKRLDALFESLSETFGVPVAAPKARPKGQAKGQAEVSAAALGSAAAEAEGFEATAGSFAEEPAADLAAPSRGLRGFRARRRSKSEERKTKASAAAAAAPDEKKDGVTFGTGLAALGGGLKGGLDKGVGAVGDGVKQMSRVGDGKEKVDGKGVASKAPSWLKAATKLSAKEESVYDDAEREGEEDSETDPVRAGDLITLEATNDGTGGLLLGDLTYKRLSVQGHPWLFETLSGGGSGGSSAKSGVGGGKERDAVAAPPPKDELGVIGSSFDDGPCEWSENGDVKAAAVTVPVAAAAVASGMSSEAFNYEDMTFRVVPKLKFGKQGELAAFLSAKAESATMRRAERQQSDMVKAAASVANATSAAPLTPLRGRKPSDSADGSKLAAAFERQRSADTAEELGSESEAEVTVLKAAASGDKDGGAPCDFKLSFAMRATLLSVERGVYEKGTLC